MSRYRAVFRRALSAGIIAAGLATAPLWGAAPATRVPLPKSPAPGEEPLSVDLSPRAPRRAPEAGTAAFADRAILLCWHSFLGDPSLPTDFSLAEARAQLDSLAALGYRFPSFSDLAAGRLEGARNIVVTIDDAHRTVPSAVDRVFSERGIRPSLFVYPAVVGTTSFSMDDANLRRLSAAGSLVGAHGYHHLFVTEDLFKRDRAAFMKEIYKAKEKTEALSSLPVLAYAYPFGALSAVTKEELARAGYAYGVAVKPGFVYGKAVLDDELELPRLVVTRDNWPEILAMLRRNAR
ncbi:MAG: polysaccharide deacetylase family protein [Spirochaetaceae bacterium]|nr:polysaccharide deacetylase family protein [Spirochaetaceae bacterium]